MTNKELMKRLTAYFLTQDPKTVARLLANAFLDFHRINTLDSLPTKETECLLKRIELNSKNLQRFARGEGMNEDLKAILVSDAEELKKYE